jgi:hypothetical protein
MRGNRIPGSIAVIGKLSSLPQALAMLALVAGYAHPSAAQISGTFVVTSSTACVTTQNGFNSSLEANSAPSSFGTDSVTNNTTFNTNGTGSVTGSGVFVGVPVPPGSPTPANSNASGWTHVYSFNYTIDSSGAVVISAVPSTYLQTFVTGSRTGQTATVDALTYNAYLSPHERALLIATSTPNIETKTFSNGNVVQQICHRTGAGFLQ